MQKINGRYQTPKEKKNEGQIVLDGEFEKGPVHVNTA